jgi:hypothetical protein
VHKLRVQRRLQYVWLSCNGINEEEYILTGTGNYWTAVIYFKAKNGTFMRVPQRAQQGLGATKGGMVSPDYSYLNPYHSYLSVDQD